MPKREAIRGQDVQVYSDELGIQLRRMYYLPTQTRGHLHGLQHDLLLFGQADQCDLQHRRCGSLPERDDEIVFDNDRPPVLVAKICHELFALLSSSLLSAILHPSQSYSSLSTKMSTSSPCSPSAFSFSIFYFDWQQVKAVFYSMHYIFNDLVVFAINLVVDFMLVVEIKADLQTKMRIRIDCRAGSLGADEQFKEEKKKASVENKANAMIVVIVVTY